MTALQCRRCRKAYAPGAVLNLCSCGGSLEAQYDLAAIRARWSREALRSAPPGIWRYAAVLPPAREPVSLGEGLTPLQHARRLGARLGTGRLWIKDEGLNPTGSFKARGMACAVSMAAELGVRAAAVASAGNAGSALAAYAAAAGMEAHVFLPRDAPRANWIDCRACGAQVTLVDGTIADCGRAAAEAAARYGWFDMGTLREPYRVEGKKTMGYELAEQMDWELPDAILYPTGGGVGLIGMWKAFEELEALGWTGGRRPRMIAVQAAGCQPVVRAFDEGAENASAWENAHTVAAGLRVPKPFGDFLILEILRRSGGTAVAVTDGEMLDAGVALASEEGIFAAPEGAACVAALGKLFAAGTLAPADRVVIYNTGSGLKYLEAYGTRFPRQAGGEEDKLGGLITPR